MTVTKELVAKLREKTGAGIMDCKQALVESAGDLSRAEEFLRRKGLSVAARKAARETREGLIEAYVHHGSHLGVLVEVSCETDFVARTEDFRRLTKDLAMQVAAARPLYVKREDVPADLAEKEKQIFSDDVKGKSSDVAERILTGKLDKFYKRVCLLEQPFIKDEAKIVRDIVTETIAKVGENIVVRRFVRFEMGE